METEEKNIRAYLEEMRIGEELIFEVLDFRYYLEQRQQEKMSSARHLPGCLDDHPIMFPFM